ncbi:diguanylate cyclase [Polycladidibacter stylochi]|uniref:GGDEF domain-containing response regulator n=1 Tax=Polycladidibacter stylochi TaxID=1807766 RepID=UPI00082F5F17|nr:diguanylate cyclase [Pseudovibrio stylochi]
MWRKKQQVLLVEDANFFAKIVANEVERSGPYSVRIARNYREAVEALNDTEYRPFLALVDVTLPDANDGEIVDLMRSHDLPTIVFSGRFDCHTRQKILDRGVVDYILKDSPASLSYLGDLVGRIDRNRKTTVLVVDDSLTDLAIIKERLSRYCLKVLLASTAQEALDTLAIHPEIRMMILDHGLPDKSGFETLSIVRRTRSMKDLCVIGISATPSAALTAKFLKCGASDFIAKSCSPEELILRISQSLNQLDRIHELTELANKDPLTDMFNRRYLHEYQEQEHLRLKIEGRTTRYAIIDIDHFKQINDQHGHELGDFLIVTLAAELKALLPKNAIAVRLGGDEFCVILPDYDAQTCELFLNKLRRALKSSLAVKKDILFTPTISVGVSTGSEASLLAGLREADTCLYQAKQQGRNKVIIGPSSKQTSKESFFVQSPYE